MAVRVTTIMSFRDLEAAGGHADRNSAAHGGLSSRAHGQPKQRRDDDSSWEKQIKGNIQKMQENVRTVADKIDRVNRGSFLSKRMVEQMDDLLANSRDLAQETDGCFQNWSNFLAGEPPERSRKKFSYDKLRQAFEEEVGRLKGVARNVMEVQKREAAKGGGSSGGLSSGGGGGGGRDIECRPLCDLDDDLDGQEARGLLDDHEEHQQSHDVEIQHRISEEREAGIRRIQSQVHDVNQIFKDLASICTEQGGQLESIESCVADTVGHTKQAVNELRKAADRQKAGRDQICCLLLAGLMLLFLILGTHYDAFGGSSSSGDRAQVVAATSPGAGEAVMVPAAEPEVSNSWGFQTGADSKVAFRKGTTVS